MNDLTTVQEQWQQLVFAKNPPKLTDDINDEQKEKLLFYRDAVFANIEETLSNTFPITAAILDEKWFRLIRDFLAKSPPTQHLLRYVPQEFAHFIKKKQQSFLEAYPYLIELVDYELLELLLLVKPDQTILIRKKWETFPDDLKIAPLFNPDLVLRCYQWPVHFIGKNFADIEQIPQGEYYLAMYRHIETKEVQFMEVNQGLYEWWEALQETTVTLFDVLQKAKADFNKDEWGIFKQNFLDFVKNAYEQGMIVGFVAVT